MNGILLVDKPAGWTSNDVVQKLRGILHERRIGHAGTLDPMATGLLAVFIGRATRAVQFAELLDKRYLACMRLGITTDTLDITGSTIKVIPVPRVKPEDLDLILGKFIGPQMQIPPMYSAIKINGQKLYQIARRGETVERPARQIEIYSLNLLDQRKDELTLEIHCSKGTYIRSLCHDIGSVLGCGACLSSLRRTASGQFKVEDAFRLEQIADGDYSILPVDSLFQYAKAIHIDTESERNLRNGQHLHFQIQDGPYRLFSEHDEFLALAESTDGKVKVLKTFYEV